MTGLTSKYGFDFPDNLVSSIGSITNQIWKLIPMYENGEDWEKQLDTVILSIAGLNEIFVERPQFLQLLMKLEGIKAIVPDFPLYRKTVFEAIGLFQELIK